MRTWDAAAVAAGARAQSVGAAAGQAVGYGPERAVIDSRAVRPGDLFVGLAGDHVDGGRFSAQALAAGAWGALVSAEHAAGAVAAGQGFVLVSDDPLVSLGLLANAWRRDLGCAVIGITGSVGKTSTKDILRAMLAPQREVVATEQNFNTEIGMPLTILAAPAGTEVLVLELAMRGSGQIAELAAIAEPDVGVVVNVGPVHLELLGSVEAIAAAKAELLAGLRPGATAIVPADEPLLDRYRRDDLRTLTFGPGGDVAALPAGLSVPLPAAHMQLNALAALAAARAIGVEPSGTVDVTLSRLRGERIELADGVVVVNDCYNANPMSMRAALHDLSSTHGGRRVAVLGDMLELGPDERRFHAELGPVAREAGLDLLITVGPLAAHTGAGFGGESLAVETAEQAADLLPSLLRPHDTVLVKGSRGVGLERVAERLQAAQA